jgi:hypothetical protein
MVHSESFGDDLLPRVGHDFGQHFRDLSGCIVLAMIVTERERHERLARNVRKRWALHVPKQKLESPSATPALRRCQPKPRADGRCAEPACPYPRGASAFCRQHSRDLIAERSPVGTAHGILLAEGLVTNEPTVGVGSRAHRGPKVGTKCRF